MSILGIIVRTRPADLDRVETALRALPGVDVAQRPADSADSRLVIVAEDTAGRSAAAVMGEIATWPEVLNTSLVYEYSGPDAPAPDESVQSYTDWRASPADLARRTD